MKKVLYIGGGLVLSLACIFLIVTHDQYSPANPLQARPQDIMSYKQAKALKPDTEQCAAANSSLTISAKDRSDVEMAAIFPINDVPAGTEVDVRIASYGDGKASGSAIYPGEYGT
jgi:hypothetical protein